jgi:hypothetical protein
MDGVDGVTGTTAPPRPSLSPGSSSLVIGSDAAFSRRARKMSGRARAEIPAETRYEAP